jgi:3-oxo-5-alpha-steroid 4-dehydrogenase 1
MTSTYATVLAVGLVISLATAWASRTFTAPYGRFADPDAGPSLPIRWGWVCMEAPAIPVYGWVFFEQGPPTAVLPWVFLGLWCMHYANRGFFFPLAMRTRQGGRMAWLVVVSGAVVVTVHAWLYATWVRELGQHLSSPGWWTDPRFIVGLATYLAGFVLLVHSEAVLRGLRASREVRDDGDGYKIPYGGGFRWVSSPHYLGELLAWAGLAVATWCPGGLFIFTISAANLVPRAAVVHRWYQERFEDYPSDRAALIPGWW